MSESKKSSLSSFFMDALGHGIGIAVITFGMIVAVIVQNSTESPKPVFQTELPE